MKLNKKNVSTVPRTSGIYTIRNSHGTGVYVGTAGKGEFGNLRHRIQSYYQDDDFSVNKSKRKLRPHAKKFTYRKTSLKNARRLEKKEKKNMRFNF